MTTVRRLVNKHAASPEDVRALGAALVDVYEADLDRCQLVAVCKACGNAGSRHLVEWYQPGGHPVVGTCPDCAEAQAKGEQA